MKAVKTIVKILGWVVVSVLAIVLLFALVIQTRPVKNKITEVVQMEVNKILKAQLHVESIDGNFFTGLGLNSVLLEYENDTIGYIPDLKLKYRLLPLLKGSILVNSVEINDPIFFLTQYPDSTWNFSNIIQPLENPDTVSQPFTMKLNVEQIEINNGSIRVNALDTLIPRNVNDFFTDLSFKYAQAEQEVDLRELRFNTFNPDLSLKNLRFHLKRDSAFIELENFLLHTSRNHMTADAKVDPKRLENSYVKLETAPIQADEFQFLIPSLKIPAHPEIKLTSTINERQSTLNLNIKEKNKNQAVDVQILVENLVDYLNKKTDDPLKYKLTGNFENLNLRDWIDNPAMDYKLTGTLVADGSGIDPKKMQARIKGDFKNMIIQQRQVSKLTFDLDYFAGDVKGLVNGSGNFGSVQLTPTIRNLFGENPSYTAFINTNKLDLSKILLNDEMASNLTMNGNVKGQGFNPGTMNATFNGNFSNARMYDFSVDKLGVALNYRRGDVNGTVIGSGDFGKISIKPNVRRLLSNNPSYLANVTTENLNLARLLSNDSLPSNLNLTFDVVGRGFDPKTMNAQVKLEALPSSFRGVNIEQLLTDINYGNNNIDVNSLLLNTESITLSAEGNYSLVANSELNLNLDIANASELSKILNVDSLEAKGSLQARVFGRMDSLQAIVDFRLDSTRFQSYTASTLSGKIDGLVTTNDTLINAGIFAGNVFAAGFALDTVKLQAVSDIRSTDLTLEADGEEVKANLSGNVNLHEELLVRLDDLMLDYKGSDWELIEPPATVRIGKNEYEIGDLKLVSGAEGASDSIQIIHADGLISRTGEQDLDLKLFNINIPSVFSLFNMEQDIKGVLDMNIYLRGTAEEPVLEGGFNVDNAAFNGFKITEMGGTINYADNKLEMDAGVVPQDSGLLELTGYIPFSMRLDSMTVVPPTGTDSVNLKVVADKLPLKIISAFFPMDKAEGYVQSDIVVNGTINNPNPVGELHIVDGKVNIKKYGIDYRSVLATLHFEKETVTVDTIFIESQDGTMFAEGTIGFNSQFYKGDIESSEIQLKFENFHPFNHRYYNMELTGDMALHGKKDSVYFDGDVNILESLIYLPAVMNLIGSGEPPEIPVPALISEMERMNVIPDSVIFRFRSDAAEEKEVKFNYFQNIQGKVKVFIPRNSWIKNEQMRFEIAGDMEMIKHRDYMELFGTVDVIRGQYEIFGKTFVVDDGTITFQGGKEFNPRLNLVANYNVRNQDRSDNELTLNVTGDLKEPKINFMMAGETLNEGDALSYILFGTNMDALVSGQEAAIATSAGSIATGTAASVLSSELTKLLGKTFNVDYIEMRAGSSFENATFVVGKYLTNKLFVSYERRFGDFKDEKMAEYEVKLEYELFRFLFLQLAGSPINNGMDLIFKIDSKTNFKK